MTPECNDDWSHLTTQDIPSDWSAITGGAFRSAPGAAVVVPAGRVDVLSDLTIISDGDLTIEGDIKFGDQPTLPPLYLQLFMPPTASPNITLVSVNGRLTIAGSAVVGGGGHAPPPARTRLSL